MIITVLANKIMTQRNWLKIFVQNFSFDFGELAVRPFYDTKLNIYV